MKLELHLTLLSDATFGRGDRVAGLVDEEVEYDAATGLPFLRGRTLKGLLVEECANIFFALAHSPVLPQLEQAARFLFGQAGSTLEDDGHLHVGPALLPQTLREAITADVQAGRLTPAVVLESLTTIRRQTAVSENGAPEEGSLRAMRVVLRQMPFVAQLDFDQEPSEIAKALLAACVLALRRAGTGRNRGRGRLEAHLANADFTAACFARFQQLIQGGQP